MCRWQWEKRRGKRDGAERKMPPLSSVQSLQKKNPQKETHQPECGLKAQDTVVKPIINMAWINGLPLQRQYRNRWCVHAKHCRTKLIINRKKREPMQDLPPYSQFAKLYIARATTCLVPALQPRLLLLFIIATFWLVAHTLTFWHN